MAVCLVIICILTVMTLLWYFVFSTYGLPEWTSQSEILARRLNVILIGSYFINSISVVLGVLFSIYFVLRIIKSVTVED